MKRKLGGLADLGRSWLLLEEEDIFSRKDIEESSLQAGGRMRYFWWGPNIRDLKIKLSEV